ncbi:haloacid dehalogenase-like hydrolase [bacterium]|nr:haloacid dehalogenase-like hydrolase [bacterium]
MAQRPLASPDEVLAACDEALARTCDAAPVAAFDADHTLWKADVGDLAWHAALEARRFTRSAGEALAREVELAGATSAGEAHEDARSLYSLYKDDRVSEDSIVRAMTVCYAGWTVRELRELGRSLARAVLDGARYEGILEIVRGLVERGIRVVVVSGSPVWLVSEGVRGVFPIDPERDVFGAEVSVLGETIGTSMREPVAFFHGKVAILERELASRRPSFAFGDSRWDEPLLRHAARLGFAVNPRPALKKIADELETIRVFEPSRTVSGELVSPHETDRVIA